MLPTVTNVPRRPYHGRIIYIEGKPYGIANRISQSVKPYAQDTGRWSQTGPPAAQLPVPMRKIIGVDKGWPQFGYDLSNAELRIVTELSGDKIFAAAFELGWDLHTVNACDICMIEYPPSKEKSAIHNGEECADWRTSVDWQGEDDLRRKFGKIFNFRVLYGGDPRGGHKIPGASKLGMTREQLTQGGENWLAQHPDLQAFWLEHGTEAAERFMVRNVAGRRRVLVSPDEKARWRQGINHLMQSLVTDLIHFIILETLTACREKWTGEKVIKIVGQMHDSLLWAAREDVYDEVKNISVEVAQRARTFGKFTFQFPVSAYDKKGK